MKKIFLIPAILLLLGATAFYGWQHGLFGPAKESDDRLVLHGNVDIRQVALSFLVRERIRRLHVEEGDVVSAGELLAELDSQRLEHAVTRAEAQMQVHRKVMDRLLAGTRQEEIEQARAEMEAARSRALNARRRADRFLELRESGSVSEQEADDVVSAAEAAAASLKAAEEAYRLALAGPRQEDIEEAGAALEAARAEVELARRELGYTLLTAPTNGTIRQRLLHEGDIAAPQTPVFTLALSDPVWVRVYVDEIDLGKIRQGMSALIRTDSFPDKRYKGWIGYISPTAEFTPKTVQTEEIRTQLVYEVRVYVPNPQGELRLGMPATVTVPLDRGGPGSNATGAR